MALPTQHPAHLEGYQYGTASPRSPGLYHKLVRLEEWLSPPGEVFVEFSGQRVENTTRYDIVWWLCTIVGLSDTSIWQLEMVAVRQRNFAGVKFERIGVIPSANVSNIEEDTPMADTAPLNAPPAITSVPSPVEANTANTNTGQAGAAALGSTDESSNNDVPNNRTGNKDLTLNSEQLHVYGPHSSNYREPTLVLKGGV
ncbi:hypothetical protein C8Q80DRAFT_1116614 [Daedaleopsis nitida]|nr:hypothetical protein C8Q80DRAFT_1116614 [Daedaleopsis nitida]